ncbi:TetR/AcrR family transcriptional regulator [Deinococcus budaensis]|uniref:AcrR family transcriptional regulator n=1 Tax=Deinococcus budaensis TaxID=1665626 RepID=A0A7W8LPW7_9DEIO|nr:TetR/AcrR family transcriptional regulator [Deinococcus budaensis]MBB5234139.1 AcrR family transcriptional regulator [Deinococcus budaensis]
MTDQTKPHQRRRPPAGRGRAQDQSRDAVIIRATLELLGEKGYHALTMTDVAARAGVSKATLYRRWTAKADVVADAVATLSPLAPPHYPGTSLRDDLLALMEQISRCDDQPEIVTATMGMARSHPDLYRTLTERSSTFVRTELNRLAEQTVQAGHTPLSAVALDVLGETVIALLAHEGGPAGASIPRERLIRLVDHVLLVLLTGTRAAEADEPLK